jgi:hypothetical protein
MPDSQQCPTELFEVFWSARGANTQNEKAVSFATEVFCNHLEYTDLLFVNIPSFNSAILNDWDKLEYWLDDMQCNLDVQKVFEPDFDYTDESAPTPSTIIATFEELKVAALNAIFEENYGQLNVGYVEIKNSGKRVFLVYKNFDAWSIGHGDSVNVVESLSELTEGKCYYNLPRNKFA